MSESAVLTASLRPPSLLLAVVWIDWYAYHVARFRGLLSTPELAGRVAGIELVGGIGVHAGLKFREPLPPGLPVHTLLPQANWQNVSQQAVARLLWAELDRLDPVAVLVPGYYTLPGLAAALWARSRGRLSLLMTESTAFDHRRSLWKEAAKAALLRCLFDGAVAGGTAHRRYLDQLGFPLDRVGRFYDVVDNDAIAHATATLRREPPHPTDALPASPFFLYVGRLAGEKNVDGLLRAWLKYRDAGGRWPLVLVGDGPAAASLRRHAQASPHVADLVFAGLRGSGELPAFYAAAGCFVLPSTREPWGLVVNEAMAAGLPVLVSNRCGSAEDLVVEGRNGFTFDPSSDDGLCACLSAISRLSSAERCAMGEQSAALIRAYSPQNFGNEIANLLKQHGLKLDHTRFAAGQIAVPK